MIDPQAQANRWIKQMYKDNLDIVKPTNKDLIRRIEAGIRAGGVLCPGAADVALGWWWGRGLVFGVWVVGEGVIPVRVGSVPYMRGAPPFLCIPGGGPKGQQPCAKMAGGLWGAVWNVHLHTLKTRHATRLTEMGRPRDVDDRGEAACSGAHSPLQGLQKRQI